MKIYDLLEKSKDKKMGILAVLKRRFPAIHLPGQCPFCTSGRGTACAGEAFWPHLHTETAAEALDGHFRREGELQEVREKVAQTRVTRVLHKHLSGRVIRCDGYILSGNPPH